MPTYSYICNDCKQSFELFFHIKDYKPNPKCACGSSSTSRDYYEDITSICGSVVKSDSELKTVGDLANRNRDRLSADEKISLSNRHNSYKESKSEKELPAGMTRIDKPKTKPKWT